MVLWGPVFPPVLFHATTLEATPRTLAKCKGQCADQEKGLICALYPPGPATQAPPFRTLRGVRSRGNTVSCIKTSVPGKKNLPANGSAIHTPAVHARWALAKQEKGEIRPVLGLEALWISRPQTTSRTPHGHAFRHAQWTRRPVVTSSSSISSSAPLSLGYEIAPWRDRRPRPSHHGAGGSRSSW